MAKIAPAQSKYLTVLLSIPLIFASICLTGFKQKQATTLALENRANEIATSWQNASFPLENFQTYTSSFGYRKSPITGKRQFHNGLDLAAPIGSYVRNWWTGRIVKLSDNTACGTSIEIKSGEWTHFYCHLSGHVQTNISGTYLIDRKGGIKLKKGQTVEVGTRIGRVGMTGRTTGPHLHWGLKYDGKYVDPAIVLEEMYRQQTLSSSSY
ncbi:MAG: M23 family metallopeptidase [Prochloraceae cyanobacterium]|nr:M23 family metallopeptidase [Prochloraceae cyanobacterium]